MTVRVREPLRLGVALKASAPAALAAIAAALLAPGFGLATAMGVAVLGSIATGAAAWFALAPLFRAMQAASNVAEGKILPSEYPVVSGELSAISDVLRKLGNRADTLQEEYRADFASLAESLMALNDSKVEAKIPSLAGNCGLTDDLVLNAFGELRGGVIAGRSQLSLAMRILQGVPEPIIATDGAGVIRFINRAGERVIGRDGQTVVKKSIACLFRVTESNALAGEDPGPVVVGPAEVLAWVKNGTQGGIYSRTSGGGELLLELNATRLKSGASDALICILGRDLTEPLRREADDRSVVRANACRRFLDRYLAESSEAIGQVDAQLRLLLGEAKQSGRRDAMVPKLAAAGNGLRQIETYHMLAEWFRALIWSGTTAPTPSEFTAVEIAKTASDRLAGRFSSRGNRLKIVDQGGWLFADADRLEGAVVGLLAHACDANLNQQVELRITRLPADTDRPVPVTEYHIVDAGPALDAEMLAAVERPFGGMAPAPLDYFEGSGGFPLALAVAARLAPAMGGECGSRQEPAISSAFA